jgi:ammonia channel protein AmtB
MRKYRRLRGVILNCILGAFVSLVPTAWLFFRSGSSQTARAVAIAVFIELAVSAAVLGALSCVSGQDRHRTRSLAAIPLW